MNSSPIPTDTSTNSAPASGNNDGATTSSINRNHDGNPNDIPKSFPASPTTNATTTKTSVAGIGIAAKISSSSSSSSGSSTSSRKNKNKQNNAVSSNHQRPFSDQGIVDKTKCIGTKPGPNDAILGRGGASNNHRGTKRFRDLVDRYQFDYWLANGNAEKRHVVEKCLTEFKEGGGEGESDDEGEGEDDDEGDGGGGRIVGYVDGKWYEATPEKAYAKVIQRLRENKPPNFMIMEEKKKKKKGDAKEVVGELDNNDEEDDYDIKPIE